MRYSRQSEDGSFPIDVVGVYVDRGKDDHYFYIDADLISVNDDGSIVLLAKDQEAPECMRPEIVATLKAGTECRICDYKSLDFVGGGRSLVISSFTLKPVPILTP